MKLHSGCRFSRLQMNMITRNALIVFPVVLDTEEAIGFSFCCAVPTLHHFG